MNFNRISAYLTTALIAGISFKGLAQDEFDALRYSYLSPQGTARSQGFGSALGSIGGDFTSLSVNPAGIGIYRTSEIMITPSLKFNGTNSTYQAYNNDNPYTSGSKSDNGSRFNIPNVGAVFTRSARGRNYENSNWKTYSFGIGMNRLADFTRNYTYGGTNSGGEKSSSYTEVFAADANSNPNGIQTPGTPGYLGYQSYLIDQDTTTGIFHTNVPWQTGINQSRTVKERGGISEIVLSFGGNYKEKLMLGATLGLPSLYYERNATYAESDMHAPTYFDNFQLYENLRTTGLGVNFKLGFIYKITDNFRIGGAFHTPTAYALSDFYDQNVSANYVGYGNTTVYNPESQFNYTLVTPYRAVGSASAIIGKVGFITADYEYVNYRSMHYSTYGGSAYLDAINQRIKDIYTGASNFRVGAEVRADMLAFRGGFGYYGTPYKSSFANAERIAFSAGLGFRFEHTYIDLSYVHSNYTNKEQPYVLPSTPAYNNVQAPVATIKNNLNSISMTIGFKF